MSRVPYQKGTGAPSPRIRWPWALAVTAVCALLAAPADVRAQRVKGTEPNRGGTMTIDAQDPRVALERLHAADGFQVNLFATEKEFPIGNPVSLTFDARGRLWVATMPSYPQRRPEEAPDDKIIILEDVDGDGKADIHTVFADKLHLPAGFELGDGGAYIAQQPNLIFAKDTNGDDVADFRRVVLHGFGTEDSHHALSAFTWGPGGGLYFQEGTFHHSQVETPYGPVRLVNAGVFRYKPNRHWLEVFVSYPFANPWGHVFDRWGQNFIADASGGANYFGSAITGNSIYPRKRSNMKVFTSIVRPTAGCEIVRSRHFPDHVQGNFLLNNTIGFQGLKQHRMIEEGSGFTSEEVEPLLYSSDINFRPVDLQFGPDGALYIVDWFNPLIGHMQYSMRDPRRDHGHGRIWRVTYKDRPLLVPPKIYGQPVRALLDLLKAYEDRTRYRVRIELRNRNREEVVRELKKWVAGLDASDPEYEHHLLEALWTYQTVNAFNPDLLGRVLEAEEPRARAAATRVLRYWRNDVDAPLALLRKRVNDPHPRVRLEAVLALSFIPSIEAAETALEALNHPTDYYLDYVLNETILTLKPQWTPAIAEDTLASPENPALFQYLMSKVSTSELNRFAGSEAVNDALLLRPDASSSMRRRALKELAARRNTSELGELFTAIEHTDQSGNANAERTVQRLGRLLMEYKPEALAAARGRIEALAVDGETSAARQVAFAALMEADRATDAAWAIAVREIQGLTEWVRSVPLTRTRKLRKSAYPKVKGLLEGLPEETIKATGSNRVRYIRIELPGDERALNLAEVEVFRGNRNIARGAAATQSSTAMGAIAARAVDGNTDGRSLEGSVAFTKKEANPWLEIDLGSGKRVDRVRIWNRTDNRSYQKRLDGFTLTWLDADRKELFSQTGIPAPERAATLDPASYAREAAIESIAAIGERGGETFTELARLVAEGTFTETSLRAISRLPEAQWPVSKIGPLAANLLKHVKTIPIDRLSSPEVKTVFKLGEALAARLPEDEARAIRKALANSGIAVVPIEPVPYRMMFNLKSFTVRAGQAVEIRFKNDDIMPHNVVVTKPGALAEVGNAAERMALEPGADKRSFVPDSPQVLFATALVFPSERQTLNFVAPNEPGAYPFVCTFPGHWIMMNGIMWVVEELEESVVLVKHKFDTDAPVSDRIFVKLWAPQDLIPNIGRIEQGRSFANGEGLFEEIGCTKCHRIGGTDESFGPNLTKIREKYNATELLEQILEPSKSIEDEYVSYLVHTTDFDSHSGFLESEDADQVQLRGNPEKPDEVVTIPRSMIHMMMRSELSTMPTGLLSTLNEEEIYDLLAYVSSGGDAQYSAFAEP